MNKEVVIKNLGYILLVNGLFLFISSLISIYYNESSALSLLFCAILCGIFGVFPMLFVENSDTVNSAEGLSIAVYGWVLTCIVGMLPYLMWGNEFTLANAWFESVSGYTTTGSTVLYDIESLPKGLLFWRSSTHWIGGIGIILFFLLIIPQSGGRRTSIYNTEISSLSKLNFHFNARKIVRILAAVYVSLTLIETIILYLFGMGLFDAINHAFSTIATGGFSTKNTSVAYFDHLGIEITIMIFMVLSGIHFGLIYGTALLKKQNMFKSSMVKSFIVVMVIGILLVAFKLFINGRYDWWTSLRHSAFQVISVGTTSGFATIDTADWPIFTQIIIIYFTIQCAMSGSTSGGLKFDRVYIFFKLIKKQMKLFKHPQGVFLTKMDNKIIDEKLEQLTLVFIVLYVLTLFTTTIILTAMDIDGMTAFSASIATIGNVGPGFGEVSSLGNFASIPDAAKYVLTVNMLLGRLEIFNILVLFLMNKR